MIDETAAEIETMQTHSSSVVAIRAAEALGTLAEREYPAVGEFRRTLERNSEALRRANPSHASLQTTQREIVAAVAESDPGSVAAAKDRLRAAVTAVIDRIEASKDAAAGAAAELLSDGTTLLTHDYSTTVLGAIERAREDDRELTAYVTEARPRYLGRKTARRLTELGVETRLIVDGAVGEYLPECDRVLLGMDCIADGYLYNRVGTYPIAATAADIGVPVTVVGSAAKLVAEGFRFENDHRVASEVLREPAEGFTVENPAYDATPVDLLEEIVTDDGRVEPATLADETAGR